MDGCESRLRRILGAGQAVIVAVDRGVSGPPAPAGLFDADCCEA